MLTQDSLADHVGRWGEAYVSVALMLFAFSSVLYNYYLGENGISYFSDRSPLPFSILKVLTLVWVFYAGTQSFGDILVFSDLSMGLLAVVNLVALVLLLKPMLRLLGTTTRRSGRESRNRYSMPRNSGICASTSRPGPWKGSRTPEPQTRKGGPAEGPQETTR